ncbi:MAG: MFS transporter [Streptosporangiaceae bacterium]
MTDRQPQPSRDPPELCAATWSPSSPTALICRDGTSVRLCRRAELALTGVDALIVVFLVRTVGLSSASAGLVVASFGVGGVLGALVARPLGRRFGTARAILVADAGGLSCAVLLPLTATGPRLAFAGVAMICVACGVVIGNVIVVSFMQTYVPPGILGRVSSGTRAVGYAMMPAGALLAGALATALGIRCALWILTALIAASGLLYLLTPHPNRLVHAANVRHNP